MNNNILDNLPNILLLKLKTIKNLEDDLLNAASLSLIISLICEAKKPIYFFLPFDSKNNSSMHQSVSNRHPYKTSNRTQGQETSYIKS